MKTTLDLPDHVLREAKATAAVRGESLRELVTAALEQHLKERSAQERFRSGWRKAFGLARPADVAEVDRVVSAELESVDPVEWE